MGKPVLAESRAPESNMTWGCARTGECLEETFRHLPILRADNRLQIAELPIAEDPNQLQGGEPAPIQEKREPWDFSDADPVTANNDD